MRIFALIVLLAACPAFAAAPRLVPTADGQVAVDLGVDLAQLPSFTWASDPFLRTAGLGRGADAPLEEEVYRLQATTVEDEDSVAVVNDRVVRVGDRVGSRTVLKIGTDFVLLGDKGSVIEATLESPSVSGEKRAPASKGGAGAAGAASSSAGSGPDVGSAIDTVLGSKGTGTDPVNRGPADSRVPANLRLGSDNRAVRAGQMLDKMLDGQMPDLNKSQGTISIEEVKK